MAARLQTLAEIEAAVWHELRQAAADRRHEWHTPVLATVGPDADGEPAGDARTVVLREVDADARRLIVYTDSRAGKVAQLRRYPGATLLMWSRQLGWQIRCRVLCEVVDDGLAVSSRWARIRLSPAAAQDYLGPQAPGAGLAARAEAEPQPQPEPIPVVGQRACFAVVSGAVGRIDWLELHRDGHRRALLEGDDARWLQP